MTERLNLNTSQRHAKGARSTLSLTASQQRQKFDEHAYSQVHSELHPRLRILHPMKPLLITDQGYKIKVQDLSSVLRLSSKQSTAARSVAIYSRPESTDDDSIWLVPPFTDKTIRVESLKLSEEYAIGGAANIGLTRQFLLSVIQTAELPFQPAVFHLVIFDLSQHDEETQSFGFGKCCANYVIPHVNQVWNDPKNTEVQVGKVVKVIESRVAENSSNMRIWTLTNSQAPEGGVNLIVWDFDMLNLDLKIMDSR